MYSLLLVALVVVLVVIEYRRHDCINDKPCRHQVENVDTRNMTSEEIVAHVREITKRDVERAHWRHAIIIGVVAGFGVLFILRRQVPPLSQLLIVSAVIAVAAYFSHSWLSAHFYEPNQLRIERALDDLLDTTS